MAHVTLEQDVQAAPNRVFAALADQDTMSSWMPGGVRVMKRGQDGLVGTVRRIGVGPVTFDEEISESDGASSFSYRITRGVPFLAHHLGTVSVTSRGPQQAHIRWDIDFALKLPLLSQAVLWGIGLTVRNALRKFAKQLERA